MVPRRWGAAHLSLQSGEPRQVQSEPGARAADVSTAIPFVEREPNAGGEVKPEKEAFAAVWRHKGFWAAQVFAFAIWAALAMSWLWLPDSKTWGVAMSVVQACVVLVSAVWLMAATFVFYRGAHEEKKVGLGASYREGLRR